MKREIANNAPRQIEANGDGAEPTSAPADVPAAQPQAGEGA